MTCDRRRRCKNGKGRCVSRYRWDTRLKRHTQHCDGYEPTFLRRITAWLKGDTP